MLNVIFEDKELIVVRKPAGIESQSSRGFSPDMVSEIKRHIHKLSPSGGEPYLGVIHRLDKPVSGVMVYAKTQKAAASLCKQVANGEMEKRYFAVLCGKPVDNVDNYVDYLLKDSRLNISKIVDKGITGAKAAKLSYQVLETITADPYGLLTLAEITLLTGRHHQIRVQMAAHKTPLWGDNKYNPLFAVLPAGEISRSFGRLTEPVALSACRLSFLHPVTNRKMTFYQPPEGSIFQNFQYRFGE